MSKEVEFKFEDLPEGLYRIEQGERGTRIIPVKLHLPLPGVLLGVDRKREERLLRIIRNAWEDSTA